MTFQEILAAEVEAAPYYAATPYLVREIDGVEVIEDEIVDERRWYNLHRMIVKHDGRFWEVEYSRPATENQDWEKEDYLVAEVEPFEVTKTEFRRIA